MCIVHENAKLMAEGLLDLLPSESTFHDYKDFVKMMAYSDTNKDCMFGSCNKCPGPEFLKQSLETWLEENDEITYRQWLSTDRCQIEKITKATDDFIQSFLFRCLILKSTLTLQRAKQHF